MEKKKEALVDVSVLILFFNRPQQLEQVFRQVSEARPSRLFLYQDGPRSEADMPGILACREVVAAVDWECEVHTRFRESNYGCDPSGFMAQRWAFSQTDKCIVLEDDVVPSVSFFSFCREMLERYADNTRIGMIAGFNMDEETRDVNEDYFFTEQFSIWGWASWSRVVNAWDGDYTWLEDGQTVAQLEAIIRQRGVRDDFMTMCRRHRAQGKPFFESVFWSHLLMNNQLCIMPRLNMINNMGVTAESTHFGGSLETLPHGYRRIFTMKRHDMDTTDMRHPRHVMEHLPYRRRAYRTMGWMCPWVKVARSMEELALNLRHGNFRYIGQAMCNRVEKMLGKKKYN